MGAQYALSVHPSVQFEALPDDSWLAFQIDKNIWQFIIRAHCFPWAAVDRQYNIKRRQRYR